MAEFEEKLNSILGNEKAMGQIMALARSLSGGERAPGDGTQSAEEVPPSLRNRAARPMDPGTCPRCWGR